MEVRSRSIVNDGIDADSPEAKYTAKHKDQCSLWQKGWREVGLLGSMTCRILKGRGSSLSYLFIPALISLIWLLVCFFTIRAPSVTLEERLSEKYLREYFDVKTFEDGILHIETVHHEPIDIPQGETVHAVIAMPFLDVNPLGATEYIQTLEWLLIYCTVPLTLHIVTNTDSIPYVEQIIDRVNKTSNAEFHTQILTLADIMEEATNNICPKLTVSEEFCDILMGKMTPLLFPYLFPKLDHAIYIDREMVFQDDIGYLYQQLNDMKKKSKAALGMAPEQTNTYMRAFAGWQRINPGTRLGRAPPEGRPGYNPSLILMDLDKLRASVQFKTYFSEIRINKLMKQYLFHASGDIPSLGDIVNLMAAENDAMFHNIGCEWNRNSKSSSDMLDKKYNVCPDVHHIRAWNGNPDQDRLMAVKERNISVGRRRMEETEQDMNFP